MKVKIFIFFLFLGLCGSSSEGAMNQVNNQNIGTRTERQILKLVDHSDIIVLIETQGKNSSHLVKKALVPKGKKTTYKINGPSTEVIKSARSSQTSFIQAIPKPGDKIIIFSLPSEIDAGENPVLRSLKPHFSISGSERVVFLNWNEKQNRFEYLRLDSDQDAEEGSAAFAFITRKP